MSAERKLTESDKPSIRKMATQGYDIESICTKYGIARSTFHYNFPGGLRQILRDAAKKVKAHD